MDEDVRLNSQLKSLGKKLFQFRDLVAKIDIPETLPPPPHDRIFWDTFVKKCCSSVTVLRQVQAALSPDMYHLSVHPGEKVWRNPAAVPDLLGLPERPDRDVPNPFATSGSDVQAWNSILEEANQSLEELIGTQTLRPIPSIIPAGKSPAGPPSEGERMIARLLTMTSRDRACNQDSLG